ncbi:MAG: hypothetical protein JWM82_4080, partial [Myxococcales bacterium]|nr:hypothetical protein [Myxococcales bacterium]
GAAGLGAIGCGGGTKSYNDASFGNDAKTDSKDTGTGPDGGADAVAEALPDPAPGDGSRLVVGGNSVELVGSGNDSCTNQAPYSSDRWCAFAKPGTGTNVELWVINATQAAAGATIKCNTTDANCLRMTSGLLDDQSFHFRIHRFDGDTLLFSEGISGSSTGDIFAWRPGWTAPRKLTSQTGELCIGNKASSTVVCIDNVVVDAAKTRRLDFHAGTLDDPNGGLLPLIDTFIFSTVGDAQTDLQRYEWDISPDGRYFAWSGRYDVAGKETLKVQKVGETTSTTVATDVSAWTISNDGAKWYWIKTFNYNPDAPAGGLESAPFPGGTPSKALAAQVGDYFQAGKTNGLIVRSKITLDATTQQSLGTLSLIPDREAPGALQALDTKVLALFDVSADGTKIMYTKNQDVLGGVLPVFDLFIAKADGSAICTLAGSPTSFADPSSPKFSGDLAVFGRINSVTGEGEGLYVDAAMCKGTKFANEIYAWEPIGDEGFVYSDDLAAVNQNGETTLRFAKAANGALPVSGTKIQTRAGLRFAPLLPALDSVMYTVGSGTTADGLYINSKLTFTTTPPVPAPDGGINTTSDAGDASTTGVDAGADTAAAVDVGLDVSTAETGGAVDAEVDASTGG